MDPLSISMAAVGITETAVGSISALRNTIDGMKEAHGDILDIHTQLENIQRPLSALEQLGANALAKETLAKIGLAAAVNDCGTACEKFEKKLQKWTRHSIEDKLTVVDKMSVGVWNREKIRTFRTRVETCQQTVHFAVSSTQLLLQEKSMRRSDAAYERLSRQMKDLEVQAREQLALTKSREEQTAQRGQGFAHDSDDESEDEAQRALAMREVHEQSRLLDETQVSLGVVFAQLRAGRTHQEIGNVVTDQESMALVGLPERLIGKMDQRIGNVSTTNKSASLVGVFDQGVDMRDFFKRA